MNSKTIIIFAAVTLGVLLGVGALLTQFGAAGEKPIVEIAGESKRALGSGGVTLVEFSDFQCPACLSVQAPLKDLLKKYDGKITFVYRYFPLTQIHKNAQMSAQAAEAAGLQGKFWEMHDKLFETQTEWEGITNPTETFIKYAETLGLDIAKFRVELESQVVKDAIQVDVSAATRYA
ncbi:MAG: thioredoxin domain-containing protein, partial [Microgenomates group bacterium]